jgi:hypothetical protein
MADIINLRRARKQLQRNESAKSAEENRARFGRSKAEKQKAEAEFKLQQRQLDAHKRDEEA